MSPGYKIANQYDVYYVTFQIVGWVDIFSRKEYRDIAVDSLKYCQQHKGLEVFAYVIMSNHIHSMVRSLRGDLSGTVRDFKNYTSGEFLKIVESNRESRRDWMKMVFEYHGRIKMNKQIRYGPVETIRY